MAGDVRKAKVDLNRGVKEKVLQGTSDKREAIQEIAYGYPSMRNVVDDAMSDQVQIFGDEFTINPTPRMTDAYNTNFQPFKSTYEETQRLKSAGVARSVIQREFTQRNYFSSKLVKALEVEDQRNLDEIS